MPRRIAYKAPAQRRRTFIREWREHRQLSQEALAGRLDMSAAQLSRLETGRQGYTQDVLEAIAVALATDVASLLMRNPTADVALWSIWEQAKPGEKKQIVEVVKALVKAAS